MKKICRETEVQLRVIAYLNGLMDEAIYLHLPTDLQRIRRTQLAVAQIRLENSSLKEGQFWMKLATEMRALRRVISPKLRSNPVIFYTSERRRVRVTHLPAWVFACLIWPIDNWVFYIPHPAAIITGRGDEEALQPMADTVPQMVNGILLPLAFPFSHTAPLHLGIRSVPEGSS
jgi:hypothetical protein